MERNAILLKNVSLSFVFKLLNMVFVYLTIPYLLKFLGEESYGVWVTIFSVVNILFFIDGGISNGLKTKLAKTISTKNNKLAKEYVSTAYFSILIIAIVFFVVGFALLNVVDLKSLLNISDNIESTSIKDTFLIALVFIVFNFIISLYKTLYYAIQKAAIVEFSTFIYRVSIFFFLLYGIHNLSGSLKYVAFIYGFVNVFIGLIFTILFFKKNKSLAPRIAFFNKKRLKDLMGLSLGFFIIQLCLIIIFATDNILISNLINPAEVTKYNITLKLFQVLITISIIVLDPFWALFSDAYEKKDFIWIRKTIKRLNKLFLLLVVFVVFLMASTKIIIKFWIGDIFTVESLLIVSMGIFVLVRVYGLIYMYFLNGIGKINLQMWLYIVGAIINIPLSILFVKHFQLGSSGIIIGTVCSILINTVFLPIQTHKFLNESKNFNHNGVP